MPRCGTDFSDHVVAVAQGRDRAAFVALFGHFAPRLKTYFLRSGAGNAEAEEMAQEAMLLVWRKAGLFDPGRAAAATWIFTIARNLRADARRRGRLPVPVAGTGPEAMARLPDPVPGAEEMVAAAQREARLRQALRTLPREQARVLDLAYFEDRSHAEIARGLSIPLGTVKARLRLALARLRAALGRGEAS
ncbi:sigma-70 family RNA polymerase sigma factor [Siccirubricoccus sp. G192]|nr:sigma-70 family RNA polymerase sigma factor [Siccirubricoccus sp. G192]